MAGICGEVGMTWEALLFDTSDIGVYDIGNIILRSQDDTTIIRLLLFVLYSVSYLPIYFPLNN